MALLSALAFYIGIPALILWFRAAKRREKEEYERKLLLQNPEAWERVKRLEREAAEKNKDRAAGAAKAGIGVALRLLKK